MRVIKAIRVDKSLKQSKNWIVDIEMQALPGDEGYGRLVDTHSNDEAGLIDALLRGSNALFRQAASEIDDASEKTHS